MRPPRRLGAALVEMLGLGGMALPMLREFARLRPALARVDGTGDRLVDGLLLLRDQQHAVARPVVAQVDNLVGVLRRGPNRRLPPGTHSNGPGVQFARPSVLSAGRTPELVAAVRRTVFRPYAVETRFCEPWLRHGFFGCPKPPF